MKTADPTANAGKPGQTRKQLRKNEKKLKKIRKQAFANHQKVEEFIAEKFGKKKSEKSADKKKKSKAEKRAGKEIREAAEKAGVDIQEVRKTVKAKGGGSELATEYDKLQKEIANEQRRRDREMIAEEEKQIKKMSKLLGYNKRKSKNQPSVFACEGIDGLLNFLDSGDRKAFEEQSMEQLIEEVEYNSDMDHEDLDLIEEDEGEMERGEKKKAKKREELEEEDEEGGEDMSDEEMDDEEAGLSDEEMSGEEGEEDDGLEGLLNPEDSGEEGEGQEDEEEEQMDEDEDEEEKEDEVGEDIYGRTVNRKTGELIAHDPAAARRKLEELEGKIDVDERMKIERSVVGIINRLSDSTMVKSTKDLHALFMQQSKNEVKKALTKCLLRLIRSSIKLQDSMMCTYALFMGLLHATCSSEISAYFIEQFLCEFVAEIGKPIEDKMMENQAIFVAHLMNFRVIKATVVLEVLEKMKVDISIGGVQMVIALCNYGYRALRKQESAAFTQFLTDFSVQIQDPKYAIGRLKFLAEDVVELKKGPSKNIDFSVVEKNIGLLHGLTKKTSFERELGMSLADLMLAEERGRWWVVGSAFRLPEDYGEQSKASASKSNLNFPPEMLELARKAGMNTEIRRRVFCSLVSAEDEDDAFERLVRLNLTGKQDREIIYILVKLLLKEKAYNEFYPAIIRRFIEHNKQFMKTTQYALWDRIREEEVEKLSPRERGHLSTLVSGLLISRQLSISVLKVVQWGALLPSVTAVMKKVFEKIAAAPPNIVLKIFEPIIDGSTNQLLSEGVRIFLQMHFQGVEIYAKIENLFATANY